MEWQQNQSNSTGVFLEITEVRFFGKKKERDRMTQLQLDPQQSCVGGLCKSRGKHPPHSVGWALESLPGRLYLGAACCVCREMGLGPTALHSNLEKKRVFRVSVCPRRKIGNSTAPSLCRAQRTQLAFADSSRCNPNG